MEGSRWMAWLTLRILYGCPLCIDTVRRPDFGEGKVTVFTTYSTYTPTILIEHNEITP